MALPEVEEEVVTCEVEGVKLQKEEHQPHVEDQKQGVLQSEDQALGGECTQLGELQGVLLIPQEEIPVLLGVPLVLWEVHLEVLAGVYPVEEQVQAEVLLVEGVPQQEVQWMEEVEFLLMEAQPVGWLMQEMQLPKEMLANSQLTQMISHCKMLQQWWRSLITL